MKKLYRRSISGLMALLICFTTILGGGITAFAASSSGEVAKSYSIGFPAVGMPTSIIAALGGMMSCII